MLDGHLLVDAHVHVPVLGSLAPAWIAWARDFGPDGILEDLPKTATGKLQRFKVRGLFSDSPDEVASPDDQLDPTPEPA